MKNSTFIWLLLGTVVVTSLLGCSQSKTMPDLSKLQLPTDDLNDIAGRVAAELKGLQYAALNVSYSGQFNDGPPVIFSQVPAANAAVDAKSDVTVQVSGSGVKVPVAKGHLLNDAVSAIGKAGLQFTITGDVTKLTEPVVSTVPAENTVVAKGAMVVINMPAAPTTSGTIKWNDPRIRQFITDTAFNHIFVAPTPVSRQTQVHLPGPSH
jgi:beta-lactam-binding protein with PASTA domain